MNRQEGAGRAYASRGFVPLPLNWVRPDGGCSCQRGAECGNPGKHPRVKWKDRADVTDAELGWWWRRWPRAGVGIITGETSGIVVIDVDPRHGGDATLAALEEVHGPLPVTLTARTGGGGWHYVFRHPGFVVQNVQNDETRKLGPGLDVRGDGGQIAAAPTLHASGRRYEWTDWFAEPVDLPGWMADRLRKPPSPAAPAYQYAPASIGHPNRYVAAALRAQCQRVADARQGERNERLFLASCSLGELVGAGLLAPEQAGQHLLRAALAKGLGEGEARPTILSGLNTGAANPKRVTA